MFRFEKICQIHYYIEKNGIFILGLQGVKTGDTRPEVLKG